MKEFTRIVFDPARCQEELVDFRNLLDSKQELEEGADVKPFFESHLQLPALMGSYSWGYAHMDLVAFQYQLFGDFGCDQVVGDSTRKVFGFIEWEDASTNSLFRRQGQKATPEWSSRVERGFSQVLDWFWKLDDMGGTQDFTARFGGSQVRYFGLVVIGRDAWLAHPREQQRWEWRSHKVLVNSLTVRLVTYDQFYRDLADMLNWFSADLP